VGGVEGAVAADRQEPAARAAPCRAIALLEALERRVTADGAMTDRFAINLYGKLFLPQSWNLF
jgi:hypothetical protein